MKKLGLLVVVGLMVGLVVIAGCGTNLAPTSTAVTPTPAQPAMQSSPTPTPAPTPYVITVPAPPTPTPAPTPSPSEGIVVTDNPQEIISFEEIGRLPRGTTMKLRLNRVGFEVREYPVELKGTMLDWGERLIVCRLSPETRQMIVAGDSGSPLLTEDGKVAGTLCYSELGDPYIFMARAIEDVLSLTAENEVGIRSYQGQSFASIPAHYLTVPGDTGRIKRWLRNGGLRICQANATAMRQIGEPALIPGSSMSVNEITGYLINGGYIGTVSYVENNKIYAFGHSLYRTGDTVIVPVTKARVIDVITGLLPFKLAVPAGANIGAATVDRSCGVVIDRNAIAETTPVATTVRLGEETSSGDCYLHRVARFKSTRLEQTLLLIALVYPVDYRFDQISPGQAHGTLTLQIESEDEQTFAIDLPEEALPPDNGVSVEQEESVPVDDIVWAVATVVRARIAEVAIPGKSFVQAELNIFISDRVPEVVPAG